MEIKYLGGGKNFARTMNYLGTVGDGTPAHKNPGLTKYNMAKESLNVDAMAFYRPYTKRDQMTFGNMKTGSKKQIEAQEA